ncbi:MAG TPA: hypothetical protein VG826_05235 [Pirellulales bacterium]|nr:hypothetical protein [Pirellulales bacterium]
MWRSFMALATMILVAAPAAADDVRDVTDANGQTWREVHRTVRHPQTETQCVDQQQTYYTEKCDVALCDTYRTYSTPVTEYRWESYWVGRFNPFVQPYLAHRLVPRTRWEMRTEVVKVPVAQRSLVPVTRTVRVPITTERSVDYDVVVSKQLISPQTTAVAANQPSGQSVAVGGVQNLDKNRPAGIVRTPSGIASQPSSGFANSSVATPQLATRPNSQN